VSGTGRKEEDRSKSAGKGKSNGRFGTGQGAAEFSSKK